MSGTAPINVWYSCKRQWSGEGYKAKPCVDDRFLFTLPPFSQYCGRDVLMDGRRWELWSPNSLERPFYPGVADPTWSGSLPSIQSARRYDGHLGRFDCTVSPQCYSLREPWLAFVRRPDSLTEDEAGSLAEHWPLSRHWTCSEADGGTRGCVSSQLAIGLKMRCHDLDRLMNQENNISVNEPAWWTERPLWPAMSDVPNLGGEVQFDWAVDQVARIQRGIRIRVAWVALAKARLARSPSPSLHNLRVSPIVRADSRYLGVWINGAQENEGLWLLSFRVPCYIIHEYQAGVDYPTPELPVVDRRADFAAPSFPHGTPVAVLFTVNGNPFEEIAKKQGVGMAQSVDPGVAIQRTYAAIERVRLSSWYQGWSRTKGYVGVLGAQGGSIVNDVYDNEPGGRFHDLAQRMVVDTRPLVPPLIHAPPVEYPFKEPTLVVMDPQRMPWVKCPPITAVVQGKSWEHWWEDVEGNTSIMVRHSSAAEGHEIRYDRAKLRMLYFFAPPDRCTSEITGDMFGRPAPRMKYFIRKGKNFSELGPHKPSVWMYRTMLPVKGTIGAQALPPAVMDLPLLSQTGKERWEIKGTGEYADDDDDWY